jgi:peptidoglycan/LPS O-acetylase OafA/YrhL
VTVRAADPATGALRPDLALTEHEGGRSFRPDVEGLRAVAILTVVAYHAGIGWLPGGFVGVDVFFVISGFLITGLLVGELTTTGRISIPGFYARRVRRLLPAIAVMMLVVGALAWLVLSPLRRQDTGGDVVAAGLFYANWHFAAQAVDYLASQQDPSPVLHMWSLSVEEQFYLVWPPLLMGLYAVGRRLPRVPARQLLLGGMTVVALASLLLSWQQTQSEAGLAYFSSFTRAWELALGGILALLTRQLRRLPRVAAALLGWFGLLAIAFATLRFTADTPFPGTAALVPTVGAAAVLAGGAALPHAGAARLLSTPPMRAMGQVSYGWYLWHWPLLVLAAAWVGGELHPVAGVAVVAVAYVLATLSLRLVENPFRRSRTLASHPGRALLMGVLCTALVVGTGMVLRWADRGSELAPSAALGAGVLTTSPAPTHTGKKQPATTTTPAPPPLQTSAEAVAPSPGEARDDLPVLYGDGCHHDYSGVSASGCVFGDPKGDTTVVLFGDSHAANWFPPLEKLAEAQHWRLVSLTKSGCPAKDIEPYNSVLKRAYSECPEWRANALDRIAKEHPDLVFTTSINGYSVDQGGQVLDAKDGTVAETDGWATTLRELTERAASVALLRDTPDMGEDVAGCVSANLDHLDRCAVARKKAIVSGQSDELAQDQLGALPGLHYLDLNDSVCPGTRCPAVIGNVLVYRDKDHLTATYATTLAPVLLAQLQPLLP